MLKTAVASGNHEITIFTRSARSTPHPSPYVTYKQIDYTDLAALTNALQGFHTVLSFVIPMLDPDNIAQKNLLHASLAVGATRFAPSEWCIASNNGVPSYKNKDLFREYIEDVEKQGKLGKLEVCLFQPSVCTEYFAHPYPLETDYDTWPFFLDFENRRCIVLDDGNQPIALTAVQDCSQILSKALDDTARPWPRIGGIKGSCTTINELLELGKKIRGGDWLVESVKSEDLQKDVVKTSWIPQISHPIIPKSVEAAFSREFLTSFFEAIRRGSWNVSQEWNDRFPEYKFTSAEEYLTKAWAGRP